MSRIQTPATIDVSPTASQPLLEGVKKQMGVVPNLFRLIGNNPAVLEGFLGLSNALGKGSLSPQTRQRLALAVAELNGCDYCLSAHTYLGKKLAKLDDAEITANRNGASNDPKADAAVKFAIAVSKKRGHVASEEFQAVKEAGYNDAQIIEIIAHVAVNTLTNYMNVIGETEIDFPVIHAQGKFTQ